MTLLPGIARTKLIIADYGRLIGILLFVVGILLLGGAAWVYANPPTTTVTDQTNEATIESTLHTSALVTEENSLYPQGNRLHDQHIYLLSATPNVTLTLQTTATSAEPADLAHKIELVTQATNDGTVFWERSRVLADRDGTSSDGSLNSSTRIDINELNDRLDPVASEIGPGSSLRVSVRVTTSFETTHHSGTLADTTPLRLSGGSYSIEPLTLETTEATQNTRQVVLPSRNVFDYLFPAGFGIGALLMAVIVGVYHRRLPNRDILAEQVQRQRYSEWISAGTIPSSLDCQPVRIEALDDLVSIAIDTNKPVLVDEQHDVFAVIDGNVVYYYGEWPDQESSHFEWVTGVG